LAGALYGKDRVPVKSGFRSFYGVIFAICIAIAGGIFWYGNQLVLKITPDDNQKAFSFTTFIGDKWHYKYIHSVEKTPCEEYFVINGANDMVMLYTKYEDFGVGLPFWASEGKFTATDDGHFIMEMNRPFKSVVFRTAKQAKASLYYAGKEIPMYKLYKSGSLVKISVDKRYRNWFGFERGKDK
jgi:hypothetical protein